MEHEMSVENDPHVQRFLQEAHPRMQALFGDVLELPPSGARDLLSGEVAPVPAQLDLAVAGAPCKNLSDLNRAAGEYAGCYKSGAGASGRGWKGLMDYIFKYRPRRLLLEQVRLGSGTNQTCVRQGVRHPSPRVSVAPPFFVHRHWRSLLFNALARSLPLQGSGAYAPPRRLRGAHRRGLPAVGCAWLRCGAFRCGYAAEKSELKRKRRNSTSTQCNLFFWLVCCASSHPHINVAGPWRPYLCRPSGLSISECG